MGAMVYRSIRRQEAGATQCHCAHALEHSLQESDPRECQVAKTQRCSQQAASRFSENRSGCKLVNARPARRKRVRAAEGCRHPDRQVLNRCQIRPPSIRLDPRQVNEGVASHCGATLSRNDSVGVAFELLHSRLIISEARSAPEEFAAKESDGDLTSKGDKWSQSAN